jgi:hypothetical protein
MQRHVTAQVTLLMKVFTMSNPTRMSLAVCKHVRYLAYFVVHRLRLSYDYMQCYLCKA